MNKGFDLGAIVQTVQGLYSVKDKKSKSMISLGDVVRQTYTAEDGIPLDESHPIVQLLGIACAPFDKIIQFAGDPDTGKSTAVMQAAAAAQKAGFIVVIWDAEDKFDAHRYDTQFGGNAKQVLLVKSNEILQGGEKVRKLILAAKAKYPKAKIALFWDSVGGTQSRGAAERELDSAKHAQPGQDAKENGAVMRMFVGLINKFPGDIAFVLANQVYTKIGFMQKGNKESGGKKVEFHSSAIVHFKRVKVLKEKGEGGKMFKTGIVTRAEVTKNHLSQGEKSVLLQFFQITAGGFSATDFKGFEKKADEGDDE